MHCCAFVLLIAKICKPDFIVLKVCIAALQVIIELARSADTLLNVFQLNIGAIFHGKSLSKSHWILDLSTVQFMLCKVLCINTTNVSHCEEVLPNLLTCIDIQITVLKCNTNSRVECLIKALDTISGQEQDTIVICVLYYLVNKNRS